MSEKRKLTRAERKQIEAAIARAKNQDNKKKSAQDSIPFERMFPDGVCRVKPGYFTKTIQFQDINYSFYSDGIVRLLEHDAASKVSFSETLLLYLRNCMNITKTALDLRIHRSSFLERLRNIESLLGTDLEDPNQRLYLQIILERLLPHE